MERFSTFQDIQVKLVGAISHPYETAVASARTCYSGRGVIYPDEVSKDEKAVALRDRIASSTLEAGHITTRQHAHFVFAISGVSRQFIWSFLHSHPYYNSEQVSQRYVRVKRGSFLMPPISNEAADFYSATADAQMATYERLIEVLKAPLSEDFYTRFRARAKQPEKWEGSINKRAYEVARYALGVGTTAYLYHTVSALTLLRYAKLAQFFDTPAEQRFVIDQMVQRIREIDPLFDKELHDELPLDKSLEHKLLQEFKGQPANLADFDSELEGRYSKLISYTANAEKLLAHSLRTMIGASTQELPDDKAITMLLDPQSNPSIAETLNVSVLDRVSQLLHHVHFTFQKKISHCADSQDQRHRAVLSSRPILGRYFDGKPDYLTPYGITQSQEAMDLYSKSMEQSFAAVARLLEMGVPEQYAMYLLPNAVSIRMISSGDLQGYHHKWKMRSCYNAQEEIFRATIDEITQVKAIYPKLAEHFRAPCYLRLRAGVKPFCPEGDKFCGLPVWKYEIENYERKSL